MFGDMFDCFGGSDALGDIPRVSVKLFGNKEDALNEVSELKKSCSENNRVLYFYIAEPALVCLTIKDGEKIGEYVMNEYINTIIRFKNMNMGWRNNSEGEKGND